MAQGKRPGQVPQGEGQHEPADVMRLDRIEFREDQGVGEEKDYINNEYIGPESKPVIDEDKPIKKDTSSARRELPDRPIGSPVQDEKKKKGFFQKIFGKKKDKQ